MMFRLAYIGAPPTIGSPAAIAPPATANAMPAAALSNLIFMIRAPLGVSPRASARPWPARRTFPLRTRTSIGCSLVHPFSYQAGNPFEWTRKHPRGTLYLGKMGSRTTALSSVGVLIEAAGRGSQAA